MDVDERPNPGEAPAAYAERLAREKAAAGAVRHPADLVLGADTIVVIDDLILGKPGDDDDARRMLRVLSGRAHDVLTAVAVARPGRGLESRIEKTRVWFLELSDADLDALVRYMQSLR